MNENDFREQDIDGAADLLLGGCLYPTEEWERYADLTHGRTRKVYQRCAEISRCRAEIDNLSEGTHG